MKPSEFVEEELYHERNGKYCERGRFEGEKHAKRKESERNLPYAC
jgi:hypothetical protein